MKTMTREQLESRKDKAVRFVRDVLDDPDRAEELEDESVDDYADRRHIQLTNPQRRRHMANGGNGRTKQDLLDEIADLQAENRDLLDTLDAVYDIVSPGDDADDDDDDDDDGGD
jgi:hypothetical protein